MNKETVIAEIKQKTGVDFAQYQTQELIEKIEAAFTSIPKAQFTILLPIGIIALLDVLWFVLRANPSGLAVVLFIFYYWWLFLWEELGVFTKLLKIY